jgi:long-chain acyl-CoA synthetase
MPSAVASPLFATANSPIEITIEENDAIRNADSFLAIFYEREKLHPNKVYLRQPDGDKWNEYTWAEVGIEARKLLTALQGIGLKKGEHVGLISKNCYQWIVADLAILMGGFVSVPYYATLSAKDLAEVIHLSEIKALFVGKLDDWQAQQDGVPAGLPCISFPHYPGNSQVNCEYNWLQIMADCEPACEVHLPTKDEVFTIIFTSGTTGTPKGVMITYHGVNEALKHERAQPVSGLYQNFSARVLSYLPLNHIAERGMSELGPIVAGTEVSFSSSLEDFANNLQSVQPSGFFAVPRIWTKFQQSILAKMPQKKLDVLLKIPFVNERVKRKIRMAMGLNELRFALTGAAPLAASTIQWFAKLGIYIQEAYGATETLGGVTYTTLANMTPGTVGKAMSGCEVKIDPSTDEVLIGAPWLMTGYYNSPEKTAEVLVDGFYHSGDTGRFDEQGNLIITGRIKDTFKSAKGQFILPVPIEQKLAGNTLIEQLIVTGMGLVQPIALLCLSEQAQGMSKESLAASFMASLAELNKDLPSYQRLSHLVIFSKPWPQDSGFYTPTLKLKRHVVDREFKEQYEAWATGKEPIVWV